MNHLVIIGCGIIGATLAYELSLIEGLKITVVDKQPPAQAATGAALGVMMGIISHKVKGKAWRMRQTSIQRYETLIPELEAITKQRIPFNRQGILMLLPSPQVTTDDLASWKKLQETRHNQGWQLEILDVAQLNKICPQIDVISQKYIGAIHSPQDRQLDPTALTLALVEAATHNGVNFKFGVQALGLNSSSQLETTDGVITGDKFIIAAGLGSSALTAQLNQKVDIRPVLGQAIHLRLGHPLGNCEFQPAITCNDIYVVPCDAGVCSATDYWVGATVEFSQDGGEISADKQLLDATLKSAIATCPELANASIIRTWSGLRPRPENRPAPVIEKLPGYDNVILASAHYRNGVLLAPATAEMVKEMIL
ncbi:MAG: FAD-binding oxidoreductase [Richelia sp. RM2_1_2]|nr:FAD-binding oxidoreductase [Richelia sp. SM2_1_7]NJM19083.1 FAD-binding oxidoreductase [Richelia sp. SM1_7_0]NJN10951.1 FAD-binding oxidoreductase [Richelia sp. RM1_1_1]NJO29261.1 FAD-binding oxidoreductase [Richelia sp. SL_2_1]NJO61594.1 FAD-binding oxidoreductase [Richelia sp. RM2_1_2]